MEASAVTAASTTAEQREPTPSPTLKRGAIGFLSNVVIGVASTAPGYSLAASIGFIVAVAGVTTRMPAVIIVSFVPMFFIALAYRNMNRADPDCGTVFSWTTRAIGAGWGWVLGWTLLFSDIVVNANQAQIAGIYGFKLFGLDAASNSQLDVAILGVVFIALLTFICWRGIELSARTQQALLGFEMSILLIFGVVAFVKAYADHPAHSMHVQAGWFNPFGLGLTPLLSGLLIGVFLFWGWDTGVSVNEETTDSATAPGRGALTSTIVLIGIFLLVATAAQSYAGTSYLSNNADDIFSSGMATSVLGSLHFLLTIAVLTSATAATQTTILPAARSALSMARRGAIPGRFGSIHPRYMVPGYATVVAGLLSIVWFVFIEFVSTNVLSDSISGLGLLVCLYYGGTGLTCVVFYRRELTKSLHNAVVYGLLPFLGFLALMGIMVKGLVYYGHSANDVSKPFLGLGVPDWIAILGVGSGVLLMLTARVKAPRFFQERRLVAGDPIETVTPEAVFAPAETML